LKVKIYVEGGGQGAHSSSLRAELRQGFQALFIKAGFVGNLPSVIAAGSRNDAFNDFKTAIGKAKEDEMILLLVDSEDAIATSTKWEHVKNRDSWDKPDKAEEENLFFMVECMESWFLADKDALKSFYGKGFKENSLPKTANLESIKKTAIITSLENATNNTTKGAYGKGAHSFKILAGLDADKVKEHGKYSKEFFERIERINQ
jgi:hypothetical protein